MNRKRKLLLNGFSGITKEVVSVVCSMILPRYILMCFGSEVNGLVSSISQFLSFISFLDMGMSAVVISNLYKPLAMKDDLELSKVVSSAKSFFRNVAKILLIYAAALCIVYPYITTSSYGFVFTASLIAIIAVSQFAQFYFGITNQLILTADQRSYVYINCLTITQILNTVISIVLMKMGCSIHIVKLGATLVFLLRPAFYSFYVNRHYSIDKNVIYSEEPIKQKWNGFIQHAAAVVNKNTDIAILSVLSSLKDASIYSVYYLIVSGVQTILTSAINGLDAMWGNMISKNEKELLKDSFSKTEWIVHNATILLFTLTGILIIPFVKLYTKGITDADYMRPLFAILLTMAFALECIRIPYFRMIKAHCHFKQTQAATLIQPIMNITISVVLVIKFGLIGVAVGTLCSMLYHTVYVAWYCNKVFFATGMKLFWKHIFTDAILVIVMLFFTNKINYNVTSYFSWMILAISKGIICLAVTFTVNLVFNRKMMTNYFKKKNSKV